MIPMMKTSWWTYEEILNNPVGLLPSTAKPDFPHSSATNSTWFQNMLTTLALTYSMVGIDTSEASFVTAIKAVIEDLMTIVYNRHSEDYIYEKTLNWNDNVVLTEDDVDKAINKILNVLEMTLPRYIPILMANKSASTDLLKPMKSETNSKNRFNDTPQDGGDFDDDNHSTNVSNAESITTADSGSLAMRLDEIFKNYRSIILEWSNEFNQLFLKEEQL